MFHVLARILRFNADFNQFLQRHGHRELDFDAYYPTWLEAPHIVLDQMKMLVELPDDDLAAQALNGKRLLSGAARMAGSGAGKICTTDLKR